jgi:heat shock protein HtpX
MATTFQTLIERNKRNSWLLVAGFTLFVAVLGGVFGYTWGYYADGPAWGPWYAVGMTGVAVAIGLASASASYFGGADAILRMSQARELKKADDAQLFNVVEEMAIAAGVPMPKVYVIDDSAPNAFATGRDPQHAVVAITTGLRSKLTREELQGVIGHEMSHVKNFDIRFALLMATLVGVVLLLCDMFLRTLQWGRFSGGSRRSSRDDDKGGGAIIVVLMVVAVALSIVAPILAKIIEMAFSRQREYLADASAVELTRDSHGLASALAKISADPDVLEVANRATAPLYIVHPIKRFEDRASSIMDSHPPIKDRIARLLATG